MNDDSLHPRYNEWLREQFRLQQDDKEDECLPFRAWLNKTEGERCNDPPPHPPPQRPAAPLKSNAPRIRGENPPLNYHTLLIDQKQELEWITYAQWGVPLLALAVAATVIANRHEGLSLLAIGLGITGWVVCDKRKHILVPSVSALQNPRPLHLFNTEFTCVLSDNSTLVITVFFEVDDFTVEKRLNQTTEKELLVFLSNKKPLPAAEIEQHLERALVRFQDENLISVLRIKVTAVAHMRPRDQPQGGAFV